MVFYDRHGQILKGDSFLSVGNSCTVSVLIEMLGRYLYLLNLLHSFKATATDQKILFVVYIVNVFIHGMFFLID